MKKTASFAAAVTLALYTAVQLTACKSALQTNGAVITTVDGAMTAWGQYTQTHQVPAGEILAVSNAYSAYYSAQMIASNTWVLAASQTNYSLVQTTTASVAANQTNLVNLINSFAK